MHGLQQDETSVVEVRGLPMGVKNVVKCIILWVCRSILLRVKPSKTRFFCLAKWFVLNCLWGKTTDLQDKQPCENLAGELQ